jgi:hypothetical protein
LISCPARPLRYKPTLPPKPGLDVTYARAPRPDLATAGRIAQFMFHGRGLQSPHPGLCGRATTVAESMGNERGSGARQPCWLRPRVARQAMVGDYRWLSSADQSKVEQMRLTAFRRQIASASVTLALSANKGTRAGARRILPSLWKASRVFKTYPRSRPCLIERLSTPAP